jgi:hypothetical protein
MSAMAHRRDISRFLLKPDKQCIIAEYGPCYYINNYILSSLGAEMDDKPMLTEKERRFNGPWLSFPRFPLGSI